ncbi:Glycogen synthase [Roseivivax jejudonensis]|uniref:Glycogen synthase n=1 Tax=Roseivivax jejudonensis TaxID=1529041 RepID=A0A1X6ZJI6_9RHOB|nr:glycosyltransferase family 4 protein [Roseivivax jejudonensis]SLN53447.1 Glycogen synthase [Roseivivax jejudonensis]
MPRVVILNDASVARGGATGLALLQAKNLAARGIETVFLAADDLPNPELAAAGVAHRHVGAAPLMKAPRRVAATRGLYNRQVADTVARTIARHDTPDTVYHVHSWSKTLTAAVFAPLAPVAPRVFIHAHDFFLGCPNGGFMDYRAMRPCDRVPLSMSCLGTQCDKRNYAQKGWRVTRQMILARTLPKDAAWGGILMIHPGMAPYLERSGYPAAHLRTLRNPATALVPERVRAEDNRGLLFIGRVEAEKGIEDLIRAAARAGVPLTVVGDGPLRDRLAAAHPQVRFTGWLSRPAIAAEARQARALVMPSRYPEPFGLVAAEASLSGLPVILSRSALLAAEIAERGLGYACDPRDADGFADLLAGFDAMEPAEIASMSRRGAAGTAGLCASPEGWIDDMLALYDAALRRKGAPIAA